MATRYGQSCPVAKTLEIIGDRWTLLIVRDLIRGPQRFQDFERSLAGIAPTLLSRRLKLMEAHGLITRRLYSRRPPRAEYTLTRKGSELGVVVGALASWGSRHVYRRAKLTHQECGHEVVVGFHCPHCSQRVRGSTVAMRAGRAGGAASRPVGSG